MRHRELPPGYDVVVFHLPALPASAGSRAATDLFRAVRSDVDSAVLVTFKGDGGVLLVPDGVPVDAVAARVDRICGQALHRRRGAGGDPQPASRPRTPKPWKCWPWRKTCSRPARLYRLADLAIEYQLARPGPARDALARVLDPLEDHPHLIDALRAFVVSGYNRGEAASALSIHRNTLTYRLGRIQLITGFDATRAADARHLAAAMTAYDITRQNV